MTADRPAPPVEPAEGVCPAKVAAGEVVICCLRVSAHDVHSNRHFSRRWTDDDGDAIAPGVEPGTDTADLLRTQLTEALNEIDELSRLVEYSDKIATEYAVSLAEIRTLQAALAARDAGLEAACRRLYEIASVESSHYDDHIHQTGQQPTLASCVEEAAGKVQSMTKLAGLWAEDAKRYRTALRDALENLDGGEPGNATATLRAALARQP